MPENEREQSQERRRRASRWAGTARNYRPRRVRADRTLDFVKQQASEIKQILREIDDYTDEFRWASPAERTAIRQLRKDMLGAAELTAALLRFGDAIEDAAEASRFAND